MNIAKKVLLDELQENGHPENVEDVIFWALEEYAKTQPKDKWGAIIAYAIVQRIKDEEKINEL